MHDENSLIKPKRGNLFAHEQAFYSRIIFKENPGRQGGLGSFRYSLVNGGVILQESSNEHA